MFWFGKKVTNSPAREGLINDFHKAKKAISNADVATKTSVAFGLNAANTMFYRTYGGPQKFCSESYEKKIKYCIALNDFEEKMRSQDQLASLGVAVFKMWIAALTEDDIELRKQIEPFLIDLSKLAPGL